MSLNLNNKNKKKSKSIQSSSIVIISSSSEIQKEKSQNQHQLQNLQKILSKNKIKQLPINPILLTKTNNQRGNDNISSQTKKKVKLNQENNLNTIINNNNSLQIIRWNTVQGEQSDEGQDTNLKQRQKMKRATPWLSNKTKQMDDICMRFHNEVVQFYEYLKPTKKQHQTRLKVFNLVKQLINEKYPSAQVLYFGSFATKLYLPDGDIDITVKIDVENDWEQTKIYDNINKIIRKNQGVIFTDIEYIRKSKVPLIKFIHAETSLQFDISVNKLDGVKQIEHVERMKKMYPEFEMLVFVFKCTLKIRNMAQTYTGGIGSFLLFCMILQFLRYVHKKGSYYTMGQLVLKFMEYYSITGDWERVSIYIADGSQVDRARESGTLSFFSPQDDSHDIGRSAFKIRDSFNMFKNRFRLILGKNFKSRQSILKQLINPQLQQFKYYRYEREQNKRFQN